MRVVVHFQAHFVRGGATNIPIPLFFYLMDKGSHAPVQANIDVFYFLQTSGFFLLRREPNTFYTLWLRIGEDRVAKAEEFSGIITVSVFFSMRKEQLGHEFLGGSLM